MNRLKILGMYIEEYILGMYAEEHVLGIVVTDNYIDIVNPSIEDVVTLNLKLESISSLSLRLFVRDNEQVSRLTISEEEISDALQLLKYN